MLYDSYIMSNPELFPLFPTIHALLPITLFNGSIAIE